MTELTEIMMTQKWSRFGQGTLALGALVACTCLGLSSGGVMAQNGQAAGDKLEVVDFNKLEALDPKNFDRSNIIDNKYFPLRPGTQLVHEGFTQEEENEAPVPHRFVRTVMDLTKVVNGVPALIAWDLDYEGGKLAESELVFFAQDKTGNVWEMGELKETYDKAHLIGGKTWLAGMDGSRGGILMKADPRPGTPSYSEGYAPFPFNWSDRAQVVQAGQEACVPAGCYKDVLVIAEGSETEGPDARQLKYYAPGVGEFKTGWSGKREKLKETLELTKIAKLTPDAMVKARAEALELEVRAYFYSRTQPTKQMQGAIDAKGQ